jgi:hypothetical protein
MKLHLIALLVALPACIFAQSNYHQGYVVKNNGDTLKGYIDYREWTRCPTSIDFKINKEDHQILPFNPHTIKEFQVNGMGTYVTYKGIISMDRTKFPDLPLMQDTSKKLDTVFLKQIATGAHLTLFSHQDEIKERFFVRENGQIVELKYSQYYTTDHQTIEKNIYRGQLIFYIHEFMPGNSKINKKAEGTLYNKGDLNDIISKINGNSNFSIPKKPFYRLFAGLGVNDIKTKLTDNTHQIGVPKTAGTITYYELENLQVTKFSTKTSPKINFGIDFFVNPDVQQLVLRTELSLSYINANFQFDVYNGEADANVPLNYSFKQYTGTFTPQILYNIFNRDDFKFYIDGGIGLNFSTYSKNAASSYDLNPFWTSLPIQTGVVVNKRIEFSFTYSPYADLTYHGSGPYSIKNKIISAGFRYLFGK